VEILLNFVMYSKQTMSWMLEKYRSYRKKVGKTVSWVRCGGWWQSDSTNRRITYEVEKFAESYPLPYTLICALFGRRTRRTI